MWNIMLIMRRLLGRMHLFVGHSKARIRGRRRLRVFALHVFAVAEIKWVKLGKRILGNEKVCADEVAGWWMGVDDHKDIIMCWGERDF